MAVAEVAKKTSPLLAKIAVAAVTALITSYFEYRSAKVEAQQQTQQVKSEADVGYQTVVAVLNALQAAEVQDKFEIARLEGEVAANRHGAEVVPTSQPFILRPIPLIPILTPLPSVPGYKAIELPTDLDSAQQQWVAKAPQ